jgi:hypothetical protein
MVSSRSRLIIAAVLVCGFGSWLAAQTPAAPAQPVVPKDVFSRLKTLIGTWQGKGLDKTKEMPVQVTYRLTGAGSALVETLFPGTPHEMMTVYHMDGDALMLTHYCAIGNQPRMVLDRTSTQGQFVFAFAGGTNMTPALDKHMHNARIRIVDADHLETEWDTYQGGKLVDTKKFSLTRVK